MDGNLLLHQWESFFCREIENAKRKSQKVLCIKINAKKIKSALNYNINYLD